MFRKILIANRGEIACRVIATAHRLGIATVAVYSDADARAKHVRMADDAIRIGPAPVTESYLDSDRILKAAHVAGADAIHPGYGFLSENPDFVEAVEAAGLTFIGPPADAIRAMGVKDAAKTRMEDAGVPVVPGYHGESRDPEALAAEAERIGYPVLIKARAGGGGKGMRLVERASDFASALMSAQREAEASFGDPHCLIERFVTSPRHIEIQVFADSHGNVVHLFERDCSLQRRHQKVIEEAPAPGMTEDVRAAMGAAAVEAARSIGYVGAGTVEFIADGSQGLRPDGFWFMEMNTRLQVEHPVTEAITGLDLVEWQIRVAFGEALPVTQDALSIHGHAIEARLYAEDPARDFVPAIGRLEHLRFPDAVVFERGPVRLDAGVCEGDEITPHYDPMIAKLITHGSDRDDALNKLRQALAKTELVGVTTNTRFLSALCTDPSFRAGGVDTGHIAANPGLSVAGPPPDDVRDVAFAAALGLLAPPGDTSPWSTLTGWRAWGIANHRVALEYNGATLEADVALLGGGALQIDGITVAVTRLPGERIQIERGARSRTLGLVQQRREITVFSDGQSFAFVIPDARTRGSGGGTGGDILRAPMPGRVIAVHVTPGNAVKKDQPLMILEAMKMEHALTAPRDGVIAELGAAAGDQITDGAVLVKLEPDHD